MIANTIGRSVEGDNFFDREMEIKRLWERFETDNVLLLAPRRVGKTSLMFHLRDTAGKHAYRSMCTSVASASTELDFVRRILSDIETHQDGRRIPVQLLDTWEGEPPLAVPEQKKARKTRGIRETNTPRTMTHVLCAHLLSRRW